MAVGGAFLGRFGDKFLRQIQYQEKHKKECGTPNRVSNMIEVLSGQIPP